MMCQPTGNGDSGRPRPSKADQDVLGPRWWWWWCQPRPNHSCLTLTLAGGGAWSGFQAQPGAEVLRELLSACRCAHPELPLDPEDVAVDYALLVRAFPALH